MPGAAARSPAICGDCLLELRQGQPSRMRYVLWLGKPQGIPLEGLANPLKGERWHPSLGPWCEQTLEY